MIPRDLLSAFPHRQFHTLPGLLYSWAALPNSNPNACVPMQGGSLYHFYDGLWYDPAERRTHDLPCERRTRYRLSQPDTVTLIGLLDSQDTLPYSYPNTCVPSRKACSLYHVYDGRRLWYDLAGTRTHDLQHKRRTHQPQLKPSCHSVNGENMM